MKKGLLFCSIFSTLLTSAQNVGIGTNAPNASAKLEITDANRGLLIPRVVLTAANAAGPVTSPATSLLVYNTATAGVTPNDVVPGYYFWDGTKWIALAGSGGKNWALLGNSGTTAGTNFLGTTDNVDLVFKVNNIQAGKLDIANNQTYFGYQAGLNSGTTAGNSFYGYNSGTANSSGTYNTALGHLTFTTSTSGNFNTTAGYGSMRSNLSGSNNTFYGVNAGANWSTTSNNTGVGMFALQGLNGGTGIGNTAIGYGAGSGTTPNNLATGNGNYNTFLGYNTALNNSAFTNATAIGANALAGASDVIILGGVNGTNGATSNIKVGIGTTIPNVPLDVNGAVAWREGVAITLVNGNNNNVSVATLFSTYRITGPTSTFTITGITPGNNGQILTIINTTAQSMIFNNNDAASTAGNRIYIPGANALQLTTQYASATFQYNATLTAWMLLSSENGSAEYWVRPTGASYIHDYFTTNARVYDAGQTWGYYYDGSNTKGSFFSGNNAGLVAQRSGEPSANSPTFTFDVYPFVDAGGDYDITSADGVTYSGIYAYGGAYNGITGIGKLDVGVRGIAMDGTGGTNASWPLAGVIGEVISAPTAFDYGQQGVYGWQSATGGAAPYCAGTYGITSQTGIMSGGVTGQYFALADDPNDGFVATAGTATDNFWGSLGYKNTNSGVYGLSRSNSAISRAVFGDAYCTTGNPSYTYGGYFTSNGTQDGRAVYGSSTTGALNYAGYFAGNHLITGTKSAAFLNNEGKPVLMYCTEMPEVWFEDVGDGKLQNGKVKISLPADLLKGIKVDAANPIKVFITPTSDIGNFWVEKQLDGFVLHATNAPNGSTFDWRIMAKRIGYEDRRLDYAGADVSIDPYVVDPYSNTSNDSKVDWKQDIATKVPVILEDIKKRKEDAENLKNVKNSNIDKNKLEEEKRGNKK